MTQSTTFQKQVQPWLLDCFGQVIADDKTERNHRFIEESLELVQACGCTQSEAHQLVDYVFGRPIGETSQEAGGVMVTLAALCLAQRLDMHECGEVELARIWTKVEQIRAKQAAKPKHSPLPQVAGVTTMLRGKKLETEMIPAAGPWMAVFLISIVVGLAVLLFGTGNNELDRYLVAGGMFSMGVLFAQKLPVWRAATSLEHARMDAVRRVETPLTPWVNFAKQVGWPGSVLFFLLICAALGWLATS